MEGIMNDDVINGVGVMPDSGAVIITPASIEVVLPTPNDENSEDLEMAVYVKEDMETSARVELEHSVGFEGIVNIITYILYALDRGDWKQEFLESMEESMKQIEENERQAEIAKRRSHLRLVE